MNKYFIKTIKWYDELCPVYHEMIIINNKITVFLNDNMKMMKKKLNYHLFFHYHHQH